MMLRRIPLLLLLAVPALAQEAPPDLRAIVMRAFNNSDANDKKERDYTYTQRIVERHLDDKGNAKRTEVKTYDVIDVYGEQHAKLVAKDDKPLDEKEAKKEEERINKIAEKRKNESPDDKKKRLAKEDKEREEGRAFTKEVGDAFDFTLQAEEQIAGRPTWVIHAEPKRGYQPKLKDAKMILPNVRGTVWIDQQEEQIVKVDAEFIDTVSYGLFVARLHKGSHFTIEQTRVNDEVWLMKSAHARFDARVLVVKSFNIDMDLTAKDYKKFRAESRVIGVVEEQPQKPPEL